MNKNKFIIQNRSMLLFELNKCFAIYPKIGIGFTLDIIPNRKDYFYFDFTLELILFKIEFAVYKI